MADVENQASQKFVEEELSRAVAGKVDKVPGKGLSTNDYTNAEKTKLSGIEAGAQKNVPVSWSDIQSKPSAFTPSGHVHNLDEVHGLDEAIEGKQDKLSPSQMDVVDAGIASRIYSGETGLAVSGDVFRSIGDLRNQVNTALGNKQDRLTPNQLATVNSGITSATLSMFVQKADVQPKGTGTEVIATIAGKDIKAPAGGEGTVKSVAGVVPNADGNVPLTAGDINALEVHDERDRRSVYIAGDDDHNEARLFINGTGYDASANLTVAGEPGTYGLASIGATEGAEGELRVGGYIGHVSVGWEDKTGVEIVSEDGVGSIQAIGETASIQKGGKEVATEEQVDAAKDELNARIDLIEATSHPNMTIVGSPTFREGNVSGFSANDYLVFPTAVSVGKNTVEFHMAFHTGADVTTQQNLMDSWCGLAFAIRGGTTVTAISTNGTSFLAESTGGTIRANNSYRMKMLFSYEAGQYRTRVYLADGAGDFADVGTGFTADAPLFATATYWGGANPGHATHAFGGIINLNECRMLVNGVEVWRGYDELPTVKFDPTATPRLDTAEKILAEAKKNFVNVSGEYEDGTTFNFDVLTKGA